MRLTGKYTLSAGMSLLKKPKKTPPHLPKTKLKAADNIIHNQSTDIMPQFMGTYTFPEQMNHSVGVTEHFSLFLI